MTSSSQWEVEKDGRWFMEKDEYWKGQGFCLKILRDVVHEKTAFQDLWIFDSESYGRCLALDGALQITERDEFSYQEMIAHLPLFAHPHPESVLIIGGGDGGVVREALKHSCVKHVTQCEIDGRVIELCKEHFPEHVRGCYSDPRVSVFLEDASVFVRSHKHEYDVVIIDSSDPVGPAAALFTEGFFTDVRDSLREGGIMCNQGECMWVHLDLIANCCRMNRRLYPTVAYAFTTIPTYPCGQIGFLLCSLSEGFTSVTQPNRAVPSAVLDKLRYYDEDVHRAAFVLPKFAKDRLREVLPEFRVTPLERLMRRVQPMLVPAAVAAAASAFVYFGVKGIIKS